MKRLLLMMGVLILAGGQYAAAGVPAKNRLDTCISYYKDGDYQKAADSIMVLLTLISDRREEAEAYKYLGFSYVMLDKIDKAREYFGVALEKFPRMTIDTLEVPPNVSNVFKQVRAETQTGTGEQTMQGKKIGRVVLASLMTATGAVGLGVGGYFFIKGHRAYRDYETTINDFDPLLNRTRKDFIIGGCVTALAAADLYFGLHLFFKKPSSPSPKVKVGMTVSGNRIAAAIDF